MSATDLAVMAVIAITALLIALQERGYIRRARTWLNEREARIRKSLKTRRDRRARRAMRQMLSQEKLGWRNFKARG